MSNYGHCLGPCHVHVIQQTHNVTKLRVIIMQPIHYQLDARSGLHSMRLDLEVQASSYMAPLQLSIGAGCLSQEVHAA